ncbi:MAG: YfiR family protein, partial [bacterium]|nr:YfiR family protein [bacterium]
CNILFVPYNCTVPIETILAKFSGKAVLIVTEQNGYGKKGAHMNFVLVDSKLKFEVNLKAINKAGIGISSFLLQHAIIVQ